MEHAVMLQSDEEKLIKSAVKLIFAHPIFSPKEITHYTVRATAGQDVELGDHRVDLFSKATEGATLFPFPQGPDGTARFLKDWLHHLPREAWGPEPDHDGELVQGWRITTEYDGPGYRFGYVLSMTPAWIVYGK